MNKKNNLIDLKSDLVVQEKKNQELFLKKHVGLIHCENKLSLMQRKICNIFLFNALDTIHDQDIHEISLKHLCSLIGYNSNDSKLIKASIKHLISIVMEWNLLEDNKFLNEEAYPEELITWNASSLLAGASIKNGMIYYSYSPQMKSVLSSLDIYGRINLFVQAKFNSTYSLVLYENCVRFKNLKQTSWFNVSLFRSLMGVNEEKYPSFKEFKRNVINVAVKEINQKADIFLEPHFKKSGRNITAIQFLLRENENYQPSFKKIKRVTLDDGQTKNQANIIEILVTEFQLSKKQANDLICSYPENDLIQKIKLVRKKKKIDHLGAYLLSALKYNYQEKKEVLPIPIKKELETSYLREAKAASEIVFLKNRYMAYKWQCYNQFVKQQEQKIKEEVGRAFSHFLLNNRKEVYRLYNKNAYSSPFVMAEYIAFLDQYYPNLLGDYLSFDDFITSEEA